MFSSKIFLKILIVMIVLSFVLAACAETAETPVVEEPPTVDEPAVDEPVDAPKPSGELVIWVQQANQEVWESTVLPAFLEEYPDIEIEFVNYAPDVVANQVGLAIQGGLGVPDLAVTEYQSITALVELGGLMDLTDVVAPHMDVLNSTMMEYCTKDGNVYCVPWDIGPVVTFYRRDIFDAAGLASDPESVSAAIATWDDKLETCQQIKDNTGLPCFALNKANNYGDILANMLWQQGLGFYDDDGNVTMDEPYVVEALEKIGAFWEADVVSDSLEWEDAWYAELSADIDNTETPPIATVTIGAWMGNFLKTWVAPDQAGNWGVALMPAFTPGGARASNQGGSAYFIPEGSNNVEAAKAFIEFINLDVENQVAQFVYSDYFPANSATYDHPFFQEPDPYFGDQVTRALFGEVAEMVPFGYIYGQYAITMINNAATAIQNYGLGLRSAQDALSEAADAVRLETGLN